jgi:hypothetical protein
MTYEEMERTMQFILEQQAQFASSQQQMSERVSRNQQEMSEQVSRNQQEINERVSRLETNMAEMARTQAHMNEVAAVMLDTHTRTEERLDAFIVVLERYISEDRNGKSDNSAT